TLVGSWRQRRPCYRRSRSAEDATSSQSGMARLRTFASPRRQYAHHVCDLLSLRHSNRLDHAPDREGSAFAEASLLPQELLGRARILAARGRVDEKPVLKDSKSSDDSCRILGVPARTQEILARPDRADAACLWRAEHTRAGIGCGSIHLYIILTGRNAYP